MQDCLTGKLLGQRAGSANSFSTERVYEQCRNETSEVNGAVAEEPLVLGSYESFDRGLGDISELLGQTILSEVD